AFVDQAAMALEKARLFEDSERRRREAEIFAELASQITASLDLDTILRRVREAARELCRADFGVIATRDSVTQAMLLRHWPGALELPVDPIPPGEGLRAARPAPGGRGGPRRQGLAAGGVGPPGRRRPIPSPEERSPAADPGGRH